MPVLRAKSLSALPLSLREEPGGTEWVQRSARQSPRHAPRHDIEKHDIEKHDNEKEADRPELFAGREGILVG